MVSGFNIYNNAKITSNNVFVCSYLFQNHRYAPSPRSHYPPTHHRSNFLVFDSNTYRHPSSSNIINNVDRHDTINQYEYSITDDFDSNDEMLQTNRQQLLLMG